MKYILDVTVEAILSQLLISKMRVNFTITLDSANVFLYNIDYIQTLDEEH